MQGMKPDIFSVPTLHIQTDTCTPQPIIPIYYVHNLQQPFCSNPGCSCRNSQEQTMLLLAEIKQKTMQVQQAAEYLQG